MNGFALWLLLKVAPEIQQCSPVRVSAYIKQPIPVLYFSYRYQSHYSVWLFHQHKTLALGIQAAGQPKYYPLFRTDPEQQQP